jgi:oligopeptide transport system substrate-binding protein
MIVPLFLFSKSIAVSRELKGLYQTRTTSFGKPGEESRLDWTDLKIEKHGRSISNEGQVQRTFQVKVQDLGIGIGLGLLCVALLGCSNSKEKPDLVIINGAEPESLDPAILTVQADGRVARSIFEGLTRLSPGDATPIPGLSDHWDISEDGTTYTFHIRTNAIWSTGEAITADDVVYSWIRALDPLTAADYAGQFFYIKNGEAFNSAKIKDPKQVGIRALDSRTLQVELIQPTPFFLDLCATTTFFVVPKWIIEKHGDRWIMAKPLPSSGPYTLEFWRIKDKIRVRKNPRYWNAEAVQCAVVDFISSETAMTALNIYDSGQADLIWDKNLIPNELMDVLGKRSDCQRFDYLGTYFMRFNVTRKPFDDVRVRKALTLAIDRKRIVEKITKSGEKPAYHFVPAGMPIYKPPQGLGYDPDAARKMLADAGYPGGKNFPTFQYLSRVGKQEEQVGVELQAMFKEVLGINMELRLVETKVYFSSQSLMDYEVSRSSWIGDYNDPNTFLDMFMSNNGNNRTGWKSAKYDDLLREGNAQRNPKKREKILQQAEALLIREDTPIAPIYFYAGVLFYRPDKIEGISFNLLDEHPVWAIRKKKAM